MPGSSIHRQSLGSEYLVVLLYGFIIQIVYRRLLCDTAKLGDEHLLREETAPL